MSDTVCKYSVQIYILVVKKKVDKLKYALRTAISPGTMYVCTDAQFVSVCVQ